jgi:hypothetical protein
MLREHRRVENRELLDVATAVIDAHRLLTPPGQASREAASGGG